MNKTALLTFGIGLLLLTSCGDDEAPTPTPSPNSDAPHSLIGRDATAYQQRMEVPAVRNNSMFIVHYTDKYGVTYTEEWDADQKTQRWAAYQMNDANTENNWKRANWAGTTWKGAYYTGDPFQEDSIIPTPYRTSNSDYRSTGFDRGHIVNSQDRLASKNANGQTYYLSNMQPQQNGFNAGIWLNMENWVHNLGYNRTLRRTLYVVKGGTTTRTAKVPDPLMTKTEIGNLTNGRTSISIPVPKFFWMAILLLDNNNQYQAIAFWAEHSRNADTNIKNYTISIDELEERTGIDFFPNLPDETERAVEADSDIRKWRW